MTVEEGTNYLLKNADEESVASFATQIFAGNCKKGKIPAGWDGKAAERIASRSGLVCRIAMDQIELDSNITNASTVLVWPASLKLQPVASVLISFSPRALLFQ